jgi:hypothetical protein
MLKTPEEYPPENTLICRKFAIFRTLLKSITRPLQGGGRWFEPSIAHFGKAAFCSINVKYLERAVIYVGSWYTSSTPMRL